MSLVRHLDTEETFPVDREATNDLELRVAQLVGRRVVLGQVKVARAAICFYSDDVVVGPLLEEMLLVGPQVYSRLLNVNYHRIFRSVLNRKADGDRAGAERHP